MADRYRTADLVICRAGATTVAELCVIGKAVIFIPFPYAADDHQTLNAGELAKAGAAEMIPDAQLTGRRLASRIAYLADHPRQREQMAIRAKRFGRPKAAADIVDDCYELIAGRGRRRPAMAALDAGNADGGFCRQR
jgi:UDP-N-acetylglucosamine--N-acetylmuramyl-(pentapeptide) pyrophosphoryl-undecaprenol N-acetylglucosamine transferase